MTINTYSGLLMATAQTGEAAKHVITHCLKCFLGMGTSKVKRRIMDLDMLGKCFRNFVVVLADESIRLSLG